MPSYSRYVAQRIAQIAVSMVGLSILVFFISRILPGDPVKLALGPTASQAQVEQFKEELGLNDPIYIQYIDWVNGVLNGQWGESVRTGTDVFADLMVRAPATIELVIVAVAYATLLAIPLGVISGTNKDRWPDHLSRFVALIGVSMPRFWLAIVLQLIFFGVLGVLPLSGRFASSVTPPQNITGFYLVDSLLMGELDKFWIALKHLALPAAALGTGTLAQVTRLVRSEMIEESQKDYIMMARSSGVPTNLIKYKYMLKNAFTSSLTIVGLAIGVLMGGAFFVEVVFAWPGMALYGVQGILYQDINAIVGIVMIIGVAFMFANAGVDLLYGKLDPRIQQED